MSLRERGAAVLSAAAGYRLPAHGLLTFVPALGAGMALYFALPSEPPLAPLAVLAAGMALAAWGGRRLAGALPLSLAFASALGLALAAAETRRIEAPILARALGPVLIEGRIAGIEAGAARRRLLLEELRIPGLAAAETPARVRLRVRALEGLHPGDRIRLRARLLPPSGPAAPGAFDFARTAYFQRLGAVGFAFGPAERLAAAERPPLRERVRQALAQRVRAVLEPPAAGLAVALITGDRSGIPEPVYDDLRDAGLAHVLAISGLHMGLVGMAVFVFARLLLLLPPRLGEERPVKKWAAAIAILGLFAYLNLAGGSPATQRAFVMAGLAFLAVMLDRRVLSMRLLAVAAAVVLLLSPHAITQAGFQMSFAAVGALIAAHRAGRGRIAEFFREAGPARRALLYFVGVLATTLIASAATAPFAAIHFNRVAAFGLIANLAVIPLVSFWIMPMAVLACLAMAFGAEAGPLVAMGWGLDAMVALARRIAEWPAAAFTVGATLPWVLPLVAGALLLAATGRRPAVLVAAMLLLAAAVFGRAPVPDLLLSDRANLAAVRLPDGRLSLTSARSDGFVAETWLRRSGGKLAANGPAGGDGGWRCDRLACIAEVQGHAVAFLRDPRAGDEECRRAAIVLSREPLRGRCPSAGLVLDRFSVWRAGALAVHVAPGAPLKARVEEVREETGARPWNPYRDRPRRWPGPAEGLSAARTGAVGQ